MKIDSEVAVNRTTARVLVSLLGWWWIMCPLLHAGSGAMVVLPMTRGKKLPSGIRVHLDTRWTDGWGYRPVRITLSVRKATRDRTIRADLYPESHSKYQKPLLVSTNVEIPQGQTKVTKVVYVPQQMPWGTMRAEFFERGRKLKDLSMEYGMGWSSGQGSGAPCVLMVDSDAPGLTDDRGKLMNDLKRVQRGSRSTNLPDAEKFKYLNNSNNFARGALKLDVEELENPHRGDDYDSLQFVSHAPNLEILPPRDLPEDYLGMAGIDVLIISFADLADMAASDVTRFRAVDFHIRSGGNLIVYGEGSIKGDIEKLLNIDRPWKDATQIAEFTDRVAQQFAELEEAKLSSRQKKRAAELAKGLPSTEITSHHLGQVVAIQSADPYDETVAYWQWIFRAMGLDRLTWPERMGVSLVHENNDYWDFMIPGFGAAPVKRFLGVICMFIIVIGPMNFLLLKRSKRLYLLPITVGIAALLTTIGMLSYAMVSDGITTRVRLRSYTSLDQSGAKRVATTHCRQSYLAAIAPSEGLVFPNHTGIYPILPYYDDRRREEELTSRTEKRILGQGYLRSRSTTQFLVTDVQETEHGIEVSMSADGKVEHATNQMGIPLTYAWIRDADGELWQAMNVAAGADAELAAADVEQAKLTFERLRTANEPQPPAGLDKNANRTMLGNLGSRRYYYRFRGSPVYSSGSILEQNMKAAMDFFRKPRPNSYLLVTVEVPPFVAQGTDAKQEAGFHIVEGRW